MQLKTVQNPLSRTAAFNPLSLLRTFAKRRWSAMACFICCAGVGTLGVLRIKPVFKAETLILVESQKIPENYVPATVQTALETRLDSLKEQVLSNERLWALIAKYNLYPELRPKHSREELLVKIREDIGIALERGWSGNRPGAFRVTFEAESPTTAANVANQLSKFFIDENLQQRSQEATATSNFLDSVLEEAKKRLETQESRLSSFKVSNIGELPEQAGSLLASLSQGRAEMIGIQDATARAHQNVVALQGAMAVAEENLHALQQKSASSHMEDGKPVATPATPNSIRALTAELDLLRARYQASHPDVQRVERELAAVKNLKREAGETGEEIPAAHEDTSGMSEVQSQLLMNTRQTAETIRTQIAIAEQEMAEFEKRRKQIIRDMEETQQRVQRLPVREQQLAAINRDYDTSKANYQSLLRKKMEADVAANMERWEKAERFVLLNAARTPEKPTRPKKGVLFGAVFSASLVIAAISAILLELRANVVLGEWELPKRVPVFGYISLLKEQDA